MLKVRLALAVATLGLAAVPATASTADAVQGAIQVSDLDLTTQAGIARFEARARGQARSLCGTPVTLDFMAARSADACHSAVMTSARQQLPALLASARLRHDRAAG